MSSDDPVTAAPVAKSSEDVIDRLERGILSRRAFLAGLGLGSIAGAGAAVGLSGKDGGFQSSATLAGTAALPASTRYYLPAVDSAGSGLVVAVDLDFADGDGGLFVDLDGVEVRHDIQLALRESVRTATRLTGSSLADTATYVSFERPGPDRLALRGKSWEAGLTVALVAAHRRRALSSDTLVTGVVDDEGRMLPVGGITAKARAAGAFGATELIVAADDETDVVVEGVDVNGVQSITEATDRIL